MNFSNAYLDSISIHFIGNKLNQQEIITSKKQFRINEELSLKLRDYFFGCFTSVYDKYHFSHESSLKYNEVYNYTKEIFLDNSIFHEMTINIARHLYEQTVHPKIKSGELYVCHFKDCIYEDKTVEAIGLFKSENKNGFFQIDKLNNEFNIEYKEGIDLNKFDKGCLVLGIEEQEGFNVFIIDSQNRRDEAQYWRDNFLGLRQIDNEFHKTSQFLGITKNFVTKQLDEEFEISKADKIDLLNRSVDYFKTHENFDKKEFEKEVFQDTGIIKSFRKFGDNYQQENEIDLSDNFEISSHAVKKQSRAFKSILKLDKNFHVYIHGDRELIEQGVEKDGRKYYKIYYNNET